MKDLKTLVKVAKTVIIIGSAAMQIESICESRYGANDWKTKKKRILKRRKYTKLD